MIVNQKYLWGIKKKNDSDMGLDIAYYTSRTLRVFALDNLGYKKEKNMRKLTKKQIIATYIWFNGIGSIILYAIWYVAGSFTHIYLFEFIHTPEAWFAVSILTLSLWNFAITLKIKNDIGPKPGEYVCEECGCEFFVDEEGNRTVIKKCD